MIEFEQILCPVDFSESSIRSLAHAAALAQWYDAQLTVLHVAPTFDAAHGPVQPPSSLEAEPRSGLCGSGNVVHFGLVAVGRQRARVA